MSSFGTISAVKLARLIGTPKSPGIIDVRTEADFAADQRIIPSAVRRAFDTTSSWAKAFANREAVVVCQRGAKLSQGVAAWLRHAGCDAVVLEGGFAAWKEAGLALVPESKLPPHGSEGRTVWVTRARPKIDRIACPWLIRRFVDREAAFLFVASSEVMGVAERFAATPFDVEGVTWSHRGELCTFDVMIRELGLESEPLSKLATIVRAADTARLDLAPEAAGLLAISLGLSRMHTDDLSQLEAGMLVYDALFRWCRDATDETHNWPTNKPRS